ncbi:MAG: DNA polymerase [Candidatus Omnitrophica bacterium]|nr:DNA polymerase [Candidatus Omnitrophota bacterium]
MGHKGIIQDVTLKQLSEESSTIVTYDFEMLVPYFRNLKINLPRSIVDVSQVGRLLIGRSHSEYGNLIPWSIWKLLLPIYSEKENLYAIKKWFFRGPLGLERYELCALLEQFSNALAVLWEKQLADLGAKGEYDRYFSIEKPINELLLERQYKGIKINEKKLLEKLDYIDTAIYNASKALKTNWGISGIYDKENIAQKLIKTGFRYIGKNVNSRIFDELADLASESSDILKQYRILKQNLADKNALLRFGAIGQGRIYPIYDPIGTVTGRILVKTPNIQQLHKTSREVIVNDRGYSLLYPDYCQFEPGILADDSKDHQLIRSYNSGDVYNSLSIAIFGDVAQRKLAKIIFLAFSFGMPKNNLVNLVKEVSKQNTITIEKVIDSFFDKFEDIEPWKKQLQNELQKEGRIASRNGNYRYRKNKNLKTLTRDEQKWVISQRVQGTAALILKESILEISRKVTKAQFLVPMHDAALYQVPETKISQYKKAIESIFVNVYKKECPSIKPKISFNRFSDET